MTRKLNCHNVYTRNPLSLENFEGYATKGNDLAFLLKIRRNSWKPFERLASRLYINHSSSLLFDRDCQSNRGGNWIGETVHTARNDNIFERSPRCFVSTDNLGYLSTLIRPSNFHPYNSFKQEENRATNSRIIIINAKRVSEKLWTLLDNFFPSKLVSRILRDSASI